MPQLRPLFVPGIGPRGRVGHAVQHASSAEKTGHGSGWPEKGPAERGSSSPPGSLSMAPQAGRPVCPPMCGPRAQAASQGRARRCALPGTVLLLLAYLAYLALGTGVFWMLESPAAQASKARFKRDKWALLRNFTCLDGPALDSLIRVREERGRPGCGGETRAGERGWRAEGDRPSPGPGQEHAGSISPEGWRR